MKIRLYQELPLGTFVFAIVIEILTNEIREDSSWTMMFSGKIAFYGKSKEKVETKFQSWGDVFETRGIKSAGAKQYICT